MYYYLINAKYLMLAQPSKQNCNSSFSYCTLEISSGGKTILKGGSTSKGRVRASPGSKDLRQVLNNCSDPVFLDFMQRCLAWSPSDRVTSQDALRHVWFKPSLGGQAPLHSITNYNNQNQFKRRPTVAVTSNNLRNRNESLGLHKGGAVADVENKGVWESVDRGICSIVFVPAFDSQSFIRGDFHYCVQREGRPAPT